MNHQIWKAGQSIG